MNKIFLTTVQFSGTRFLNYSVMYATDPYFTRMQIANVKGFYRLADTVGERLRHTNTNNIEELISKIEERFAEVGSGDFTSIITAHIGDSCSGFIPFSDQEKLIDIFPTAVTLRDPLLSLLSREGRKADDRQEYLVDGFVSLAETKKKVFHVPVDLYASKLCEARVKLLTDLFNFLGITPLDKDYINITALEWRVRGNTQADHSVSANAKKRAAHLKNLYRVGDIKEIIKIMPRCYEYLKSKELILRPMLEEAGYTNLLWWS